MEWDRIECEFERKIKTDFIFSSSLLFHSIFSAIAMAFFLTLLLLSLLCCSEESSEWYWQAFQLCGVHYQHRSSSWHRFPWTVSKSSSLILQRSSTVCSPSSQSSEGRQRAWARKLSHPICCVLAALLTVWRHERENFFLHFIIWECAEVLIYILYCTMTTLKLSKRK